MISVISSIAVLVTFIVAADLGLGVSASSEYGSALRNPRPLPWFLQRSPSKRGVALNKCQQYSACALLQANPTASSYWIDEICHCADGTQCSLEWDDAGRDGRSVNNADTQLKLCQPITTAPLCTREQTAVTTSMETSVANPTIKQAASVFCNCPRTSHEYKLIDAGMVDEGDRTVVTAQFGCASVEHCGAITQPCKFLAVLPTGDQLIHQSCECPHGSHCPRDVNPDGITPATLDEIVYYPFKCVTDNATRIPDALS